MPLRIFSLAVAFFALSSCGRFEVPHYDDVALASLEAYACGFVLNSKGQRLSWKNRTPLVFYFSRSVPDSFRQAIASSGDVWNQAFGLELIRFESSESSSTSSTNDRRNVVYWSNDPGQFTVNEQAKTTIRWRKNEITDADVILNAGRWNFVIDGLSGQGGIHLQSLMVHELGHALGLIHQNIYRSVMYPFLSFDLVRNSPLANPELASLGCEYQ